MNAGTFAATGVPTGANTAAAAAAVAAERRRNREEELLTAYSQQELNVDWEFKILRSARGEFKKPERLAEVLEEESQSGWVLVEKFDDSRIRLKRSPEARHDESHLGIDPWRSYVGPTSSQREARIALLVVVALLAGVGVFLATLLCIVGAPG